MNDIVDRLIEDTYDEDSNWHLRREAAAEISSLRRELGEARLLRMIKRAKNGY